MSRGRRTNDNPLSLFSFQDVITGITGIMILIVLMLVLEVISRKALDARTEPQGAPEVAELEETAQKLAATKRTLQREVDEADRMMEDLAGEDPEAKKKAVEEAREKNALLKGELEKEREKALKMAAAADEAEEEAQDLEGKLEHKTEVLEDAQQERENLDHIAAQVTIDIRGRLEKVPVIVECSGNGIKTKTLGDIQEIKSFEAPGRSVEESVARFLQWAGERDADQFAFFALIKPGAVGYASELVKNLSKAGFDVGYEPLEGDKTAVFIGD